MRILATGMSGTVGKAMLPALLQQDHSVVRLKTGRARPPDEIPWQPLQPLDPKTVSGFDAVIHLAGEDIFGRWTAAKKQAIRDSRVIGTRNLCQALAQAAQKPATLIAASAIGYYGSNENELLTEESSAGSGFLADVARAWEQGTQQAAQARIRVVNLRIGVVLSREGGALARMLTPFRLGLGGKIGGGEQWFSWIAVRDVVGAILHCLRRESLRGPVNLTAPQAVTNAEFTRALAKTLHRPAFARVPAFTVRLLLGKQMAREILLAGQRVYPAKLLANGYKFEHPELEDALRNLLSQ